MLLVLTREGQLCNQLFTLAHAYAIGLEYNDDVKCPVMDDTLKKYFAFKRKDQKGIEINMYESFKWKILVEIVKIYKRILNIKSVRKYNTNVTSKQTQIFFEFSSFSDASIVAKHKTEIITYFGFKKYIKEKCERLVQAHRVDHKVLVGVHIRRGDYRTFRGGEWFYDDLHYCNWMSELSSKKNVRFLLFSNEKLDVDLYLKKGLDVVIMQGSAVEDLCCMSLCDYIMGPPSTYSSWASLYGNKERLVLVEAERKYTWDDFCSWDTYYGIK